MSMQDDGLLPLDDLEEAFGGRGVLGLGTCSDLMDVFLKAPFFSLLPPPKASDFSRTLVLSELLGSSGGLSRRLKSVSSYRESRRTNRHFNFGVS